MAWQESYALLYSSAYWVDYSKILLKAAAAGIRGSQMDPISGVHAQDQGSQELNPLLQRAC